MNNDELRLGDIPGLTEQDKKDISTICQVLLPVVRESVRADWKSELQAMEQRVMKRVLEAKISPKSADKQEYVASLLKLLAEGRMSEAYALRQEPKYAGLFEPYTQANEITTTSGAGALPAETVNDVLDLFTKLPGIHTVVRRVPVTAASGKYPLFTSSDGEASVVSELNSSGNISPTISSHSFSLLPWRAKIVISGMALRYSVSALYQGLIEYAARVLANTYGKQIARGSDTNEFQGLENASISSPQVSSSLIFDYIRAAYMDLPAPARASAVWTMNSATLSRVWGATDGSGRFVLPQERVPDTLLGRPVIVNDYHNDGLIFVGDPKTYHIYEGMVLRITEVSTGYTPLTSDIAVVVIAFDADGGVAGPTYWQKVDISGV